MMSCSWGAVNPIESRYSASRSSSGRGSSFIVAPVLGLSLKGLEQLDQDVSLLLAGPHGAPQDGREAGAEVRDGVHSPILGYTQWLRACTKSHSGWSTV